MKKTREMRIRNGISGSTLKLIAIVTMAIDHVAAAVLERVMVQEGVAGDFSIFMQDHAALYWIYAIMRLIGRIAFPIYSFLLVEGLLHTKNKMKYAIRLFVFVLVSEVPFDLAFTGQIYYPSYQNVFFTLFIGLLVLIGFEQVKEQKQVSLKWQMPANALILLAGMLLANLCKSDYGAFGVVTIVLFYAWRGRGRTLVLGTMAALCLLSVDEITAAFAFIPIHRYNGTRGWNHKFFFYAFYPLHLLVLYAIAMAMGLGADTVMMVLPKI